MIREGPVEERAGVTLTNQSFSGIVAPGTSLAIGKGREVDIRGPPHNNSSTPIDLEILELLGDLEDTANMPQKRKNLGPSLQAGTTGAGQSSNSESPPAGRQKRQRREGT